MTPLPAAPEASGKRFAPYAERNRGAIADVLRGVMPGRGLVVEIASGAFRFHGKYTSASNAQFNQWLKEKDGDFGVRDIDDLGAVAERNRFAFSGTFPMPANNHCLVWRLMA